ncbi:MAG: tetratricopeptide repeat protein, partial [Spirulinaceae cyanobacterium]
MAKSTRNPLKHLAGGFLLLSLHLGTIPTLAQTQPTLTTQQTAQLEEANRLNQQVLQMLREGQYTAAIPLAQQALAIREQALSSDHPDVATS